MTKSEYNELFHQRMSEEKELDYLASTWTHPQEEKARKRFERPVTDYGKVQLHG